MSTCMYIIDITGMRSLNYTYIRIRTYIHTYIEHVYTILTLSDTSLQPLFSQRWYHPSVATSVYVQVFIYY